MKKLLIGFLILFANLASAELRTVPYVDPALYLGTWYQIARNPHPFEQGCVCSRQILSDNGNGQIGVYNTCNSETVDGKIQEIRGIATNDDPTSNSKFTVDFGLFVKGKYWIIALAQDYQWAVVSEPGLQSLYILSKTPELAQDQYDQAVQEASLQIDVSRLQKTLQKGCSYPASSIEPALNAPVEPAHPGSKVYNYGAQKGSLSCAGRKVDVYLPVSSNAQERFPAVVYGHGQALSLEHYAGTFEHLAKKGVAVVFPMYDNGFFDQEWIRMGRDFVNVTDCALKQYPNIERAQLVFSGHSKGAYVASIAAGLAVKENLALRPGAVVLFQSAGYEASTIGSIEPTVATTVIYSDRDTVVDRGLSDSIYANVRSVKKQFILVKSYPAEAGGFVADHYWPQTKGFFMGGGPENALHYYGAWKWLVAAGLDLKDGGKVENPYLYGAEASDKGLASLKDDVTRSW
jgi:apolipoprotein D and lipocalin family protein